MTRNTEAMQLARARNNAKLWESQAQPVMVDGKLFLIDGVPVLKVHPEDALYGMPEHPDYADWLKFWGERQ